MEKDSSVEFKHMNPTSLCFQYHSRLMEHQQIKKMKFGHNQGGK